MAFSQSHELMGILGIFPRIVPIFPSAHCTSIASFATTFHKTTRFPPSPGGDANSATFIKECHCSGRIGARE
jgi:hypothetical protein